MAEAATADSDDTVRELRKCGWLTYGGDDDTGGRGKGSGKQKSKHERVWAVLCLHDDTSAHLEGYPNQKMVVAHKPSMHWPLASCVHVSMAITLDDQQQHPFTITLKERLLGFSADSNDQMIEWIDVLCSSLKELGILKPSANLYSKEPEAKASLAPCRDPMSPLPPTPDATPLPLNVDFHHRLFPFVSGLLSGPSSPATPLANSFHELSLASLPHSAPILSSESDHFDFPSRDIFNFSDFGSRGNHTESPSAQLLTSNEQSPLYEPLYVVQAPLLQAPASPQPAVEEAINPLVDVTSIQNQEENGQNSSSDESVALSSSSIHEVSASSGLTLKLVQVLQLRREMEHRAGVRIKVRLKDCVGSIAFVDILGAVWIAGWKQRKHPFLYNNFHIGDQVISIAQNRVLTAQEAHRLTKHAYTPAVEFIILRLPFGKALALRRDFEGQSLGFEREENSAEIKRVHPEGLVARGSLTAKTKSPLSDSFCNWTLTEINGRPLHLFCKDSEIETRLNAVGKDISLLVQPADFVCALKKQLKMLRSYKDFIVH